MRIALILLSLLLIAAPAAADTDVAVSIGVTAEDYAHSYNSGWYWGDMTNLNGVYYSGSGLTIGVGNDDWGARFGASTGPAYYPNGYYQQPIKRFDSIITPLQPMIEPYTGRSTHPNDRSGYRIAIPRGLGGPPQLYGDYEYDQYGNPVPAGGSSIYSNQNHHPYRRTRPVVINYSYGYYPYRGYQPVYTAPSYPEYGYVGAGAYPAAGYSQPQQSERQDIRAEAVNVYEGDVYNYYYADPGNATASTVPNPLAGNGVPTEAEQPPIQPDLAYGMRFYEQARLETPDGTMRFRLEQGRLSAGPDNGPAYEICAAAEMALGAYAAYTDADGIIVLYGDSGRLTAAYPLPDGSWLTDPLPHAVDFNGKITLGLVGGMPWVVFNATDGARYVLSFAGRSWQEIGSATNVD